jgi:putative peptide zinc metalloprotease protein
LISSEFGFGGNMTAGKTFSESWHRIADQRISLRSTVKVRKQLFRGEKWYVLHDPFNNQFLRLRPEAYEFVVRLRPDRTVGQVWEERLEGNPDGAPGQDDVIQLLAQLYFANLLYYELPADSAKLFERYSQRKQRELQSKLLSIMFFRLPLLDPENLLRRLMPAIRLIMSPLGTVIWIVTVVLAGKVVIDHFDVLAAETQGILTPDNLIFLYASLVLVKTLHEFGHAVVCKHYGGEVHTIGVMLLVFTPLPYMDATSSWSFRSRWERAFVGAAGMIFEIFAASFAAFIWAYTGPGIVHSIAFNMMFIASVSTVLFNINPLLRFDGYYILSDLLDIPNLHSRARMHLRHIAERYVFGCKDSISPAQTPKEASWLTIFGVLSGIYRVIVYTAIILFVADRFLLAGMIMAFICIISWGLVPLFRFTEYLLSNPRLVRTRSRAIAISLGAVAAVLFFLAIIPFPNRFRAPGVLEAVVYIKVVNDAPGYVKKVLVPTNAEVKAGTPLMELSNRELDFKINAANAQRQETLALQMQAIHQDTAELKPIRNRLETIEKKLNGLEEQRQALVVRARESGTWISPRSKEMVGTWLLRGSEVGVIVNHEAFQFSAVVSQDEASNLFDGEIRNAEVRLFGQGRRTLEAYDYTFIPYQHEELPSAALGWHAGGEIAVSVKDETGLKAAEPFFQIYAKLNKLPSVTFLHGRSGQIRFYLNPEPLLEQWVRKFRQLLQKRYQI